MPLVLAIQHASGDTARANRLIGYENEVVSSYLSGERYYLAALTGDVPILRH